jgi:hypothetical protein
MAYGDIATLYRMAVADPSFDFSAASEDAAGTIAAMHSLGILSYHTANVAVWKKRIGEATGAIGSKFRCQCVNLVQAATNLGLAKEWRQGPAVQGNTAVPPGTIIAAGWVDGRYPNSEHNNTAAIFLEHTNNGAIKALHQWMDTKKKIEHPIFIDTFRVNAGNYRAEEFCVVLTIRRINDVDWSSRYA